MSSVGAGPITIGRAGAADEGGALFFEGHLKETVGCAWHMHAAELLAKNSSQLFCELRSLAESGYTPKHTPS